MGVVMERWCPTQPVLGVFLGDGSEETYYRTNSGICGCVADCVSKHKRRCRLCLSHRWSLVLRPMPGARCRSWHGWPSTLVSQSLLLHENHALGSLLIAVYP